MSLSYVHAHTIGTHTQRVVREQQLALQGAEDATLREAERAVAKQCEYTVFAFLQDASVA